MSLQREIRAITSRTSCHNVTVNFSRYRAILTRFSSHGVVAVSFHSHQLNMKLDKCLRAVYSSYNNGARREARPLAAGRRHYSPQGNNEPAASRETEVM